MADETYYRAPAWLAEAIARVVEHLREEEKRYGECLANDDRAGYENHIQLSIDSLIDWLDEKGIEHNGTHSLDNLDAENGATVAEGGSAKRPII